LDSPFFFDPLFLEIDSERVALQAYLINSVDQSKYLWPRQVNARREFRKWVVVRRGF